MFGETDGLSCGATRRGIAEREAQGIKQEERATGGIIKTIEAMIAGKSQFVRMARCGIAF